MSNVFTEHKKIEPKMLSTLIIPFWLSSVTYINAILILSMETCFVFSRSCEEVFLGYDDGCLCLYPDLPSDVILHPVLLLRD